MNVTEYMSLIDRYNREYNVNYTMPDDREQMQRDHAYLLNLFEPRELLKVNKKYFTEE